jgi:signal transduction histidine kinase/streptogramin lyase
MVRRCSLPSRQLHPAWIAVFLACLAVWCRPVRASDDDTAVPGYYRTEWTSKAGAPDAIKAIVQSPEGFLWLGSNTGLYRFDGINFERFEGAPDSTLPVGRVTALALESDGSLWISAAGNEVLRLNSDRIVYRQTLPVTIGPVLRFVTGPHRQRLLLATNGLFKFTGMTWVAYPIPELPASAIYYDARFSDNGALWLATDAGLYFKQASKPAFVPGSERSPGPGTFANGPGGITWYCGQKGGLYKFGSDGVQLGNNAAFPCYRIFIDRSGVAWTDGASGAGAAPVDEWMGKSDAEIKARLVHGIFGKEITLSSLQDEEGSIWLGSTDGLRQFRLTRLREHPDEKGSGGIAPASGGGLWLISYARGLMHVGSKIEPYPVVGKALTFITRDRRNVVWIGSHNRDVLIRIDDREVGEIPFPPGTKDVYVNGIGTQSDGSPWLFTQPAPAGSVYHYVNGQWLEHGGIPGLPDGPPSGLFIDPADRVWLSYPGGRLYVITGKQAVAIPGVLDLNLGTTRTMAQYGNDLILAGDGGLALMQNGRFHKLALRPPAQLLGIVDILVTKDGDLWINQPSSLLRIAAADLERAVATSQAIDAEIFDYRDGRRGPPIPVAPHSTLAQTDDGRLWVSAMNLTSIDPANIERNTIRPRVGFRHLTIDGLRQDVGTSELVLTHDTKELLIGYMSSSIALPERVQFRYRLEGLDSDWKEGNPQREATYNQLRPGEYTFRIMASNNDGLWSQPAILRIHVLPSYYQTVWFALLCLTIAFVLVGLLVRARIRWVAERIRDRLQERSRERERIARELHDTLLQGIQGLILQFHLVADELPANDANRKRMESALDRADRLMSEGRQRVSDLRLQDVGASLGVSLHRQLLDDDLPACPQLVMRECGQPLVLSPMVQTELLRIAHEAVSNALHHGDCKRLWVVIRYDKDALRMRIKDDGCGITHEDIDQRKPGHWGITGMQERARSIGAKLSVEPGKRMGTAVNIVVPAAMAYARHLRRRWRRALWR